jgi:hypothetical protein
MYYRRRAFVYDKHAILLNQIIFYIYLADSLALTHN